MTHLEGDMKNPLIRQATTRQKRIYKAGKIPNGIGGKSEVGFPRDMIVESYFIKLLGFAEGSYFRLPKYFCVADRVVLDYFGIIMDMDNSAYAPQAEVAKRLGYTVSTVSGAMKALKEHDYIRIKSGSTYIVNPDVMCKCSVERRLKLVDQYEGLEMCSTTETVKDGGMLPDEIPEY